MGDKKIHAEAIKQEDGLASYTGVVCAGHQLPEQFKNLIYSKWMRSYRFGNDMMKIVNSNDYYAANRNNIARILADKTCIVCLAVLTDDRDVVLGFSVTRGTNLDYVHVHKDNRKVGIGTFLIPKDVDSFSHVTNTWLTIWNNKYSHWKFNPFI